MKPVRIPVVAAPTMRDNKAVPAGPAGAPVFAALPPLSLYVHFPWCVRKCPYCDFNSHAKAKDEVIPEARYLAALAHDIEVSLPLVWGRRVHSVFIGGGTPSLMSASGFDTLLATIRALLPLEANPGTFEAERFSA